MVPVIPMFLRRLAALGNAVGPLLALLRPVMGRKRRPCFPTLRPSGFVHIRGVPLPVRADGVTAMFNILKVVRPGEGGVVRGFILVLVHRFLGVRRLRSFLGETKGIFCPAYVWADPLRSRCLSIMWRVASLARVSTPSAKFARLRIAMCLPWSYAWLGGGSYLQ